MMAKCERHASAELPDSPSVFKVLAPKEPAASIELVGMHTIAHISDSALWPVDPPWPRDRSPTWLGGSPHLLVVSGDFTQRARPANTSRRPLALKRLPQPNW